MVRGLPMSDLVTLMFEECTAVRLLDRDGEAWFVLNDICRALGLTNPRQAVRRLEDDERSVISSDTRGGPQLVNVVNEAGMYSLILSSRKPEARRFKRWVTHEVLPTLRRTGVYDMRPAEPLDRLVPYLHDHQLRILHALEAAADDGGLIIVGRLPRITGLSIQKIRRTLYLFEALRAIWWETPDLVRLRRSCCRRDDESTPASALLPEDSWLEEPR